MSKTIIKEITAEMVQEFKDSPEALKAFVTKHLYEFESYYYSFVCNSHFAEQLKEEVYLMIWTCIQKAVQTFNPDKNVKFITLYTILLKHELIKVTGRLYRKNNVNLPLFDFISAEDNERVAENKDLCYNMYSLQEIFDKFGPDLDEREREIVAAKFSCHTKVCNRRVLAEIYNVSREYIRQIETRAMQKLGISLDKRGWKI